MSRWAKVYMIAITLALLGFVAFFVFTLLLGRAQRNETPEIIGNIAVAGRIVTPRELDALFQDPSLALALGSDLYLVTRAWVKAPPSKTVVGAEIEFVSPEFLKGRRVFIGSGFRGRHGYDITHLEHIDHLSEEQKNLVVASKPELRVVNAWVK